MSKEKYTWGLWPNMGWCVGLKAESGMMSEPTHYAMATAEEARAEAERLNQEAK